MHATRPQRTRAARHRGLQRHGINRVPAREGANPAQKQCTPSPLGDIPIDIAAVRTDEGQLSLCVAMDRTCTLASAERHDEANNLVAAPFLRPLVAAVPDQLHTVLTANGMQFTNRTRNDATVKKYHDQTHHPLKAPLQAFLMAYNLAKRLKTLKGLTPDEYICRCWQQEPERVTMNPYHHIRGLNT